MKHNYIYLLTLICCLACAREKEARMKEVDQIIEPFFEGYRVNGPKEAVRRLLGSNKYIPQRDVDSVGVQLERLVRNFGAFQGVDRVSTDTYGESIVDVTYLVNYEKQPIRFQLQFYQPGTGWRLQNFRYNSEFMNDLK